MDAPGICGRPSMLTVRDFVPEDMPWLQLQRAQQMWLGLHTPSLDVDYGAHLWAGGPAWTVTDKSGWIVAACGFHEIFPTYAVAWALLAEGIGHRHLALTRLVKARMREAAYPRIEALIRADFPPAAKWAALVGLQFCATIRAAGPALEDYHLYERVNQHG